MEGPKDEELKSAQQEVDSAMHHAEEVRDRSNRIADGWRKSRRDNNFRQMIRALIPHTE